MSELSSSLEVATVANALLWPLAAGAAVVAWSKSRASARARRLAEIEAQMQSAYRDVEAEPTPARLSLVIEALEEGEELAGAATPKAKP